MRILKIRFIISIFFFIISFFTYITEISAVAINPVRLYKKVKYNKTIKGKYKVTNDEKRKVKITIEKSSQVEWFDLEKKEFILNPGESKSVKYRINVNDTSKKGELKSGIVITQEILAKKEKLAMGAAFKSRTRLPVYVLIDQTAEIDYDITKINFNGNFSKRGKEIVGQMNVDLGLRNSGSVHFLGELRLMVYEMDSTKRILKGEERKPTMFMLFPKEVKDLSITHSNSWKPGEYMVRVFCYFKFDDDLEIQNVNMLKKERCLNITKRFTIDQNGKYQLIE